MLEKKAKTGQKRVPVTSKILVAGSLNEIYYKRIKIRRNFHLYSFSLFFVVSDKSISKRVSFRTYSTNFITHDCSIIEKIQTELIVRAHFLYIRNIN